MEIILLEKIKKLGSVGDVVTVKNGYARNYLLPRGKVLRATKENVANFNQRKNDLAAENAAKRTESISIASKIDNVSITIEKAGAEDGRLYGSINKTEFLKELYNACKIDVSKYEIDMGPKIKSIGEYQVKIKLHAEVEGTVNLHVRRLGVTSLVAPEEDNKE